MKKISLSIWGILLSLQLFATSSSIGTLNVIYGDNFAGNFPAVKRYELITDKGIIKLNASDKFIQSMPLNSWHGRNVKVIFKEPVDKFYTDRVIQSITLVGVKTNFTSKALTGSQPWVSILCKFSDINAEPQNLAYFQGLYSNNAGGMDHYWRETSYNDINTLGSTAVDWVNLPSPQTTYIPIPGSAADADLDLLFDDCTSAADAFVNYADAGNGFPYVGINMMFNDLLDCCAWGGGHWANLDGASKAWRVTWEPPWGYANAAVIAHEMGHGFGLPHSNNSDGDTSPYDSPWGVMSAATSSSVLDATYGARGKHITMAFKYDLGWVTDSDGFIATDNTNQTITVDRTSKDTINNFRFAKINLSNGTYYMVEARKKVGEYDANLPGEAIIINHVNNNRSEPPWIVDEDNPPATFSNNEGVMWKVGETFFDTIDGYSIEVFASTNEGFEIIIKGPNLSNDLIFSNSFE